MRHKSHKIKKEAAAREGMTSISGESIAHSFDENRIYQDENGDVVKNVGYIVDVLVCVCGMSPYIDVYNLKVEHVDLAYETKCLEAFDAGLAGVSFRESSHIARLALPGKDRGLTALPMPQVGVVIGGDFGGSVAVYYVGALIAK